MATKNQNQTNPMTSQQFPETNIDDEEAAFRASVQNLMGKQFQVNRPKTYPHCLVVNKEDDAAGYFVPVENMILASWIDTAPKLSDVRISAEKIQGMFFNTVNFVILCSTPVYFAWKKDEKNGVKSGAVIDWAENLPRDYYKQNKEFVDICQDRLIYLLDDNNELLHKKPLTLRHRNVHMISIGKILENTWEMAERAFAERFGFEPCSMDDKWRSLVVHKITFAGEMVGPAVGKQHACCKVKDWRPPTAANIKEWLLRDTPTPEGVKSTQRIVWAEYNFAKGFLGSKTKMLPPPKLGLPEFSVKGLDDELDNGNAIEVSASPVVDF